MASELIKARRRLLQATQRSAAKAGVAFDGRSQAGMEKLVHTALQRMRTQNMLEDETRLQLAEGNLRRVVDAMAKRSAITGSFPIADVECLEISLQKMCPLWPFC
ncbi:MAG: hypothetical protein LJE84_13565 [Gammaproteobacteria bacterium]|jgi:hypothetical protein|nr:hypothetical protein [Gammaproteobacteria bacterium]